MTIYGNPCKGTTSLCNSDFSIIYSFTIEGIVGSDIPCNTPFGSIDNLLCEVIIFSIDNSRIHFKCRFSTVTVRGFRCFTDLILNTIAPRFGTSWYFEVTFAIYCHPCQGCLKLCDLDITIIDRSTSKGIIGSDIPCDTSCGTIDLRLCEVILFGINWCDGYRTHFEFYGCTITVGWIEVFTDLIGEGIASYPCTCWYLDTTCCIDGDTRESTADFSNRDLTIIGTTSVITIVTSSITCNPTYSSDDRLGSEVIVFGIDRCRCYCDIDIGTATVGRVEVLTQDIGKCIVALLCTCFEYHFTCCGI